LDCFKQCQTLIRLPAEGNDRYPHQSICTDKVFAFELLACVYQTIGSRFYDNADFGDNDDDSDEETDEDEERAKYCEYLKAAEIVGKAQKSWINALEDLENAATSNLSASEIALNRFTASMHKMEVLWVYSSYAYDRKENYLSLLARDDYGLPVTEKKDDIKVQIVQPTVDTDNETSQRKGKPSNSIAMNASIIQEELAPTTFTLIVFRNFVEVFLQHMHSIHEELTKQPNETTTATAITDKPLRKQEDQDPALTVVDAKCQAFFADGRYEFYDSFFHWINTYLEISIVACDLEVAEFMNHRVFFGNFPFSKDDMELTKLLEKDADIIMEIASKHCLTCVEIHRQLYDANAMKIKGLEANDLKLGYLNLYAFNERMNHEKAMVEPMIDLVMEKLKVELYDIVREGYANPPTTNSRALHYKVKNKYEEMKKRLFGACC
jgi:hypothetical protein